MLSRPMAPRQSSHEMELTQRSTPSPRSPGCAWASCVRCDGATSTSRVRSPRARGAAPMASRPRPSRAKCAQVRSSTLPPSGSRGSTAGTPRMTREPSSSRARRQPRLRRPASLALRQGARARRPAPAALPRPSPHLRHARDYSRRHRRGPKPGWVTLRSRRRCGICTIEIVQTRRRGSMPHSRQPPRGDGDVVTCGATRFEIGNSFGVSTP